MVEKSTEELSEYIALALASGADLEQLEKYVKRGIFLTGKQLLAGRYARECDREGGPEMVGMGGGMGGGKSRWAFTQVFVDDLERYRGLKFLVLRQTSKAIKEQTRTVLEQVCGRGNFEFIEYKNMVRVGESVAILGHYKDDSEIDNYLGQEYDGILIEELTTISEDKFRSVLTRLRTSKPGWRPRLYATWNWGGVGHEYVRQLFYVPWKMGQERKTRFVFTTIKDNPYINKESEEILKSLTGWRYESWYLGNPDIAAGSFFKNFDARYHVFPGPLTGDLPLNRIVRWFGSLDYGYRHPTCFLLHARDDLGNDWTVAEYVRHQAIIRENAWEIRKLLEQYDLTPDDLDWIAAGKDCFSVQPDGRTIAMEYEEEGITLEPVTIDRVNGWAAMLQRLGEPGRGIPATWFIHQNCVNLIEQIRAAEANPKKSGDIVKMNANDQGQNGDDALEAARNFLVFEQNNVLVGKVIFTPISRQPYYSLK